MTGSTAFGATDVVRYGIIGTGLMGIEHIENLAAIDGATVTAIADPHPVSMAAGMSAAPNATAFEHHHDLIDSGCCDAIVIATPNHTHVDILGDALATELPVLVEKPLCTTVADCKRVILAATDRRAPVVVALEYRYMAPIARTISEVANHTVGTIHTISMREHRFPFLSKVDNWNRFSRNTGGTLVEKCCHFFDLMNLLARSRPERVYASGGQACNHLDERYDGEPSDILDHAFVTVEYHNGIRASLDLNMFAEATRNQEELVVVGDQGKIEALIPDDVVRIGIRGRHFIGEVDEYPESNSTVPYQGHHHGSSYVEHLRFLDTIRTGRPPEVSLTDGLWSVAIGEAAHRSIDERRVVEIDDSGQVVAAAPAAG